jgi:hypothetical protein
MSTPAHTPIAVNFNVEIDASGNLTVFSAQAPVIGNTIVAERTLPVLALYNSITNKGLIELWEPSDRQGDIRVQLANTNMTTSGGLNLTDAYQAVAKDFAKGLQAILCDSFDCRSVEPFSNAKYTVKSEYYKQRDFGRLALATYAHYLFGHIDATAGITNDKTFVHSMLSISAAGDDETAGGAAARAAAWTKSVTTDVQSWVDTPSTTDANLAIRLVKKLVSKGLNDSGMPFTSLVSEASQTPNGLANIVAQVVGQDATRLMNADNSERTLEQHILLRFYPDDIIYMNIKLTAPNVSIGAVNKSVTKLGLEGMYPSSALNFTLKIKLAGPSVEEISSVVTDTIQSVITSPATTDIVQLKSYLSGFTTENPAPAPTITVTDVPITALVTNAAASFNTAVTYEVNFVLLTNNTATVDTVALTENSVLYIPSTPGIPVTIIADATTYTITATESAISVNGTTYTLGQKVILGNKTFLVAFSGSVGLVVQNASPGIAKLATRIGGATTFSTANIVTDTFGNVYIRYQTNDSSSHILYNYSSAPVNSGEVITSIYGTISGSNAYLVKYNASGIVQWATLIPSSGAHSGSVASLACDSSGNVYLVGQAASDVAAYNFTAAPVNNGAVTTTQWGTISSSPNSPYYPNIWVIKYTSAGSVAWGTMIKGSGESLMPQCATDSDNNFYIIYCTSQPTITLYNYTSAPVNRGTVGLTVYGTMAQPSYTHILIKYSSAGSIQWGTSIHNTASDAFTPSSIACDSSGNIIVCASCGIKTVTVKNYSSAPVSGGAVGLSNYGTIAVSGYRAPLLVKYNTQGVAQLATYISGSFGLMSYVSCDAANNIYLVTNGKAGTLYNFNSAPVGGGAVGLTTYGVMPSSPVDVCFIAKYNSAGVAQWATRFQGGQTELGRSICDSAGNVYIAVRTSAETDRKIIPVDFTSAPVNQGTIGLTNYGLVPLFDTVTWPGYLDTFLIKYTTNGKCAWATRVGGLLVEKFGEVAVDTNDNVFFVGAYASNPVYISNFVAKPATSTANITLETYGTLPDINTSAGGNNIFLIKYGT